MTVAHLGALTVGGAVPGAASAVAAGSTGISLALPDIQARLTALLAAVPLPVNFATSIAIAQSVITSLEAAIAQGIVPPSFSAQIAQFNAAIATLTTNVLSINAQLTILTSLVAPLGHAGLVAYAFDGDAGSAGGELGSAISGDLSGHVNVLAIATGDGGAWTALGQIVKVTP